MSLRGEVWTNKTSLTPSLFPIEVLVSNKEMKQSRICELGVQILSLSAIFLLDLETVLTVWDFYFVYHSIQICRLCADLIKVIPETQQRHQI
jgi:hypothetical protein